MPPSCARNASLVARSAVFTERRPFLSMWTGGGSSIVLVGASDWLSEWLTLVALGQWNSYRNRVGCASAVAVSRERGTAQKECGEHLGALVLRQAQIYGYLRVFLAPGGFHARGAPSRSPAEVCLHARGAPSRSPAEGSVAPPCVGPATPRRRASPGTKNPSQLHFHGTNVPGERQRPGAVVAWSTSGAGPQVEPKVTPAGHSHF